MKRFSLLATLIALFAFIGCEPVDNGPAPVLTSTTEGDIVALSVGGQYSLTYAIENPRENGSVEATSDAAWLSGWDYSVENTITFEVAANETAQPRRSEILVTYNYDGGEPKTVTVVVMQGAAGSDYPILNLTSKENVEMGANGGDFEITFELLNPAEGGEIKISSDDWITTALEGETSITATVAANDGAARTGKVTVSYEYPGDIPASFEVNVNQSEASTLTFEIEVEPSTTTAVISVYPSDKEAAYIATIIDNSWYQAGYGDEDIMLDLIAQVGGYMTGDLVDQTVSGMSPGQEYHVIAFGIDLNTSSPSTELFKETFRTTESQPTDAYVEGSITNWWSIDDLAAYNPSYAGLAQAGAPNNLAAVDFEFNDEAAAAYYVLWTGDMSGKNYDDLFDATLSYAYIVYKGGPSDLFYVDLDGSTNTLCTIGVDASGNYGDMDIFVVTFTEAGKSTDFGLFDEYYNALMGYSAAAETPAILKVDMLSVFNAKTAKMVKVR